MPPDERAILAALEPVVDPELELSIVELGLVEAIAVAPDGAVHVSFTTTTPSCPLAEVIAHGIRQCVGRLPGVTRVTTELVLDPPWTPDRLSALAIHRLARLR